MRRLLALLLAALPLAAGCVEDVAPAGLVPEPLRATRFEPPPGRSLVAGAFAAEAGFSPLHRSWQGAAPPDATCPGPCTGVAHALEAVPAAVPVLLEVALRYPSEAGTLWLDLQFPEGDMWDRSGHSEPGRIASRVWLVHHGNAAPRIVVYRAAVAAAASIPFELTANLTLVPGEIRSWMAVAVTPGATATHIVVDAGDQAGRRVRAWDPADRYLGDFTVQAGRVAIPVADGSSGGEHVLQLVDLHAGVSFLAALPPNGTRPSLRILPLEWIYDDARPIPREGLQLRIEPPGSPWRIGLYVTPGSVPIYTVHDLEARLAGPGGVVTDVDAWSCYVCSGWFRFGGPAPPGSAESDAFDATFAADLSVEARVGAWMERYVRAPAERSPGAVEPGPAGTRAHPSPADAPRAPARGFPTTAGP